MHRLVYRVGIGALLAFSAVQVRAQGRPAQGRPAPPPSRYGYLLEIDEASLPEGGTVRADGEGEGRRLFIANDSDVPLVLYARYENKKLVGGTKLVSGQVYQYFPNGVPMEGKTHLKGWQAPFGEITETILYLAEEPAKIYEGRQAGLSDELPSDEPCSIPARYDGKRYSITGTVRYHLNEAYDEFYRTADTEDEQPDPPTPSP
jgi:hypothetical protein